MSQRIEAQLLGTPSIYKDGKEVFFSYNKVNALVYYILTRRTVMRDELGGLLWGDKPDIIARKNLRNALYEAKKILGQDVFISPRKAIIKLNPDIDILVDVERFEERPAENIELYKGEFLQGFYIKDSIEYEDWYLQERNRYRSIYIEALESKLLEAKKEKDYTLVERYGRELISTNPYDEYLNKLVIESLCELGKLPIALIVYEEMKELFQRELGAPVPDEIERYIGEELSKSEAKQAPEELWISPPIGRDAELEDMMCHIDDFLMGRSDEALMVLGDSGSGKSSILEAALSRLPEDMLILSTNCYQMEQQFLLHPWAGIVSSLMKVIGDIKGEDLQIDLKRLYDLFPQMDVSIERDLGFMEMKDILKFDSLFHTLSSVLDRASKEQRLVICFEDVHWMDSLSLSLLSSVLLRKQDHRILFVLTSRESHEKDFQHFLVSIMSYKKLHVTELSPLGKKAIRRLAEAKQLSIDIDDNLVDMLWRESNGNLFIINESLIALESTGNMYGLTDTMETLYKVSLLELSEMEEKLLVFISLFYNGAPISMMAMYMQMQSIDLIELLESLEDRRLIQVTSREPELLYKVSQQKFKDYIHQQISKEKWAILHGYIGDLWEGRLTHSKQDISLYKQLEYHYKEAHNLIKMGRYKIRGLMNYLKFSHEATPSINSIGSIEHDVLIRASYFTEADTLEYLTEMEDVLERIIDVYGLTPEVQELELMFLQLVGQYYMREGQYDKGVRYILDLIDKSIAVDNRDYTLTGYKQMIYYDIQSHKIDEMEEYIQAALDLAVECNYHKEVGILLRLKGLNLIMQGRFEEAEKVLLESISIFTVTQTVARRYALNIAAAYNYLGEIRRGQERFEEALTYYNKAITICSTQEWYSSLVVFLSNAGIVSFQMGRYDESLSLFEEASRLYKAYNLHGGQPLVDGYLGYLGAKRGDFDRAIMYLESAFAGLVENHKPRELGHVNMLLALIKYEFSPSNIDTHFKGAVSKYAGRAMKNLDKYVDTFGRKQMEDLADV